MAELNLTLEEIDELNAEYRKKFGDFPPTMELGGGKEAYELIQKAVEEDKPIKIECDDRIY